MGKNFIKIVMALIVGKNGQTSTNVCSRLCRGEKIKLQQKFVFFPVKNTSCICSLHPSFSTTQQRIFKVLCSQELSVQRFSKSYIHVYNVKTGSLSD